MLDNKFNTIEEGFEKLKERTSMRNQMGGSLYWNMLNDSCCDIANQLKSMGGETAKIEKLLGEGNYTN